ncbi:tripartite tricarboxylate transporter TctB family protein [Roseicyclus persicicus]|uniref:Tripartite tricarboxylate transporter TctB family protein n=1 Tax=Roseicyclus persicicus TaxID=2650661 RepID=A0A7X6H0H6_9RHOB|nr:tripartite tricarboxylate transporter TctB family protein [Roseibacterium persicicum]NKX44542.1 tripartite tricarboxylate transporter TctB family protein [Roseibacterium persicicum]
MRIVFLVALLGGAIFYTYIAFSDLNFMTRTGRLGPGFFPRLVGAAMVVMTFWAILDALRDRRMVAAGGAPGPDDAPEGVWRDFLLLLGLAFGYAILVRLFGGFVSTVVYLIAALSLLNPGRHLQNALVAVIFPTGVYVLFDRVLNANMPPALFDILPF